MIGKIPQKRSHTVFYGLLSLLLLLCFIRYTFQINIPQILLLGIACFMAVVGDEDEVVAMCMCCIPLYTCFEYAYAVLFGMVVYVVKFGGKMRLNLTIIPVLLMVLWETAHCFGFDFAIAQYAGRFVAFLLLAMLMCCNKERFDYAFVVRMYAVSAAVMCCSLIGKRLFLSGFDLLAVFADLQRLGVITEEESKEFLVTGAEMNTNSLGIICVLGVTGLLQLRLAGEGKKVDYLLIVTLLMFGVMTSSRTYLVCLLLMVVLLVFSLKQSLVRKLQFIAAAVAVAVLVVGLMSLFVPDLLEYYVGRFAVEDITTGRDDLMTLYHEFIMSNLHVLLCGIGAQDLGVKATETYQIAVNTPHNAIQETVLAWGIPGILMFLALWASMIYRSRKLCKNQGLINYIPLIIILVKAQAGQMLTSQYTMLSFSFAYLSMCADLQPGAAERVATAESLDAVDSIGVDFGRAVALLWKRKIAIALAAIVGAVAAYGITAVAVTPKYESKAMLFVNNARIELKNPKYGIYSSEIFVSRSLVSTYQVILKTRDTLNQVIEQTGVDLTYEELRSMITTSAVNETEIFEVKVRSEDPVQAQLLANAIADVLPGRIAGIVDGAAATVVDYAVVAKNPSWPSKATHALLGFILGLVLMVTILLLRAMLDTTLRTDADLAEAYPYPVLSSIPDLMERNQQSRSYYYYSK